MTTISQVEEDGFIPLEFARRRLATIWFPSCGFIILILVAQTIGGAYGSQLQRAWSWALPNFLPTLSLMISAFAADALKSSGNGRSVVRKSFCNLTLGLSVFYLMFVLIPILAQPFAGNFIDSPDLSSARLALLEYSNYWLGPMQGLVTASLGTLFFTKQSRVRRRGS